MWKLVKAHLSETLRHRGIQRILNNLYIAGLSPQEDKI